MTGRRIVLADSLLETSLGLVLAAGAAASWLGPGDFPAPVGTPVIVASGCALLIAGAVLWRLATKPVPPRLLLTLATANLATATAATTWRLAATGFSTTGSALTLATAGALVVLAAAQLREATRAER